MWNWHTLRWIWEGKRKRFRKKRTLGPRPERHGMTCSLVGRLSTDILIVDLLFSYVPGHVGFRCRRLGIRGCWWLLVILAEKWHLHVRNRYSLVGFVVVIVDGCNNPPWSCRNCRMSRYSSLVLLTSFRCEIHRNRLRERNREMFITVTSGSAYSISFSYK